MKRIDYFQKYLTVAPFALSLWRAQEAETLFRVYSKYVKLPRNQPFKFARPVLDVGCGFGEFAGVFFDTQIEIGIDISLEDLLLAKSTQKYNKLLPADARNLPFNNNVFATVISVSALEHISRPAEAFAEIYRVLKPGGIFIFTVPTSVLNDNLFYPSLLNFFRLNSFSKLYLTMYHHVFKHHNIYSPEIWKKLTQSVGFEIVAMEGTFTSKLTRLFDIFLLTALPSQLCRWLTGSRWIWGLPWKRKLLKPLYKYVVHNQAETWSNILIMARKPKLKNEKISG